MSYTLFTCLIGKICLKEENIAYHVDYAYDLISIICLWLFSLFSVIFYLWALNISVYFVLPQNKLSKSLNLYEAEVKKVNNFHIWEGFTIGGKASVFWVARKFDHCPKWGSYISILAAPTHLTSRQSLGKWKQNFY